MKFKIKDEYKKFCELLDFGHGKYDTRDVFKDFVVMLAISIKNSVSYKQEDEDIYLGIIKKYEKNEREYFIEMACELIKIYFYTKEIKDVLGEIYTQIGATSKANQQFFTPYHIARAMGRMILDKGKITKKEYIKVYDPTCGSGVLLLGYINELKDSNIDYENKVLAVARDIDFVCTCMTYIQLSVYKIPAIVILGNSVLNEVNKIFCTPEFALGGWDKKLERM